MKPIDFPESNTIFAKNQPEYLQLPAHRTSDGVVTTCYILTWKERFAMLFGGKLWHRKNKRKDLDRCNEICHHLGCEFIILREGVGGIYLPEHIC